MSTLPETATPSEAKPSGRHLPQLSWTGTAALVLAVFATLAFVRAVTGANDLTSSGTFGAALRLAVPIGLAALGGLYAERAGVVNIGLEGMMILGTWFGAWAGWQWGPWAGVAVGIIGGALGGGLHALATVTFGVDHVVSGVAINILALGVTRYLASAVFTGQPGASATLSPPVEGTVGRFTVPFLAGGDLFGWETPDFFGALEKHHWFFVSDLAGVVKGLTSNLSWLTVIAVLLVPFSAYLLWHTKFGLRLRSVGEAPTAADSLGVPVYLMKYIGVVISGGLAGLAGAYLVLESAGRFKEGQTGGRGFIGLAALDLRQLASRRPCDGCRALRLRRRAAAEERRLGAGADPVRRDRRRVPRVARDLRGQAAHRRGDDHRRGGLRGVLRDHREGAVAVRGHHPVRDDPVGARVRGPAIETPRCRRLAVAQGPADLMADIDWAALRAAAVEAASRAYAPYSHFHVGAAGLVEDGRVITACNVENASYGLTLCAECGLVSTLHAGGGGRLIATATRTALGDPVMPCGRCRQLLWEAGGAELLVDGDGTVRPMSDLLPGAFDAERLAEGG